MSEPLASFAQLRMTAEHAKNLIAQVAEAAAGASEELAAKVVAQERAICANPPGSSVPAGGVIIWAGAANDVPDGWALCDGCSGTPDLRDGFVLPYIMKL